MPPARAILRTLPRFEGCALVFTNTGKTALSGFSPAKARLDRQVTQDRAQRERDQLEAAVAFARQGDTLVVTKPDRLARSVADMLAIMARLEAKGVALRVLSMGGAEVDTNTPTGRMMLTMLGAVAEFERALMLERQREGIAKAKTEGRYKGRAPTARAKAADVLALHAEKVAPAEIARRLGIGRASVYRILAGGEGA